MIQLKSLKNNATCLGIIKPAFQSKPINKKDIRKALLDPIYPDNRKCSIFDIINPGESVCFVVSDHTRKTAVNLVLPVILEGLIKKGCLIDDMFILVASGIHRHPSQKEITNILGKQTARAFKGRVFLHDPDDKFNLFIAGKTKRGHAVRVNKRAMEADRLVPLGSVVYHYHAGFGGGRKSLVPGIAARKTIAYNHSLTLDPIDDRIHPMVKPGVLDGNPVSEEMLEAAYMCRPDITVNTVLSSDGKLIGVFSGELDTAHRAACKLAKKTYGANIAETADIVIASAGAASNWIQSHKALFNASRAVKKNGRIILIAPCREGLGNERFRYWIKIRSMKQLFRKLRKSPEVLGQTALSTKMRGKQTILITQMPSEDIKDLGIETAPDLNDALGRILRNWKHKNRAKQSKPSYYIMPDAGYILPILRTSKK